MSRKVLLYGLLCLLCVPFVFPTWWMVTSSMKPISEIFSESLLPSDPTLSTYSQVFRMQPFGQQYLNSLYIAVIVKAGTTIA